MQLFTPQPPFPQASPCLIVDVLENIWKYDSNEPYP